MSVLDSVRRLCRRYPGGVEAVAQRLGKSPATLRHELAGAPGYKLGLLDVEEVLLIAKGARVDAYMEPLDVLVNTLAGDDAPEISIAVLDAMGRTSKEFADLCARTSEALHGDGYISDNELRDIEREAAELMSALRTLRQAAAANNRACNAHHQGASHA